MTDQSNQRPRKKIVPRWLYRYSPIPARDSEREEGFRRLLTHNELYFSHPLAFNDPFDCTCLFRLKGSTADDWRAFYADKYPQESSQQIDERVARILGADGTTTWAKSGYDRERLNQVLRAGLEEVRIVCLSERWDSILMWAHYGHSHGGVCLQFDHECLASRWMCEKVVYRSGYPTFREFLATGPTGETTGPFLLLNKANPWRYEREWRVVAFTFVSKTAPAVLPEGALRSVHLGCHVSDEDRDRILSWVKESGRKDLAVYDVKRHSEEYRLIRMKRSTA